MCKVQLVVLGVGAGSTCMLHGEPSSSFIICIDSVPVLMLDVGLGSVAAALKAVGSIPQHIYVSHNHTDHAGELPVLLAVEAAAGRRKTLLAESSVLDTLQQHRLAELRSTGKPIGHFAELHGCVEGQLQQLPCGLALQPLRSRHSEPCWGLLVYWQGRPVLGWTADSGYAEGLYRQLAAAPLVLMDGRAVGSSEHAGFEELQAAVASGVFGSAQCCVYGYGTTAEAPADLPGLRILHPGDRLPLEEARGRVAARYQATGVGDPSGKIVGKAALKAYFQEALEKVKDLRLDLQHVLTGVDSCCLVYTRETGAQVAEVFKLDEQGKATSVQVYYDLVC